jgi:Fe2+ transport system protein FeoA
MRQHRQHRRRFLRDLREEVGGDIDDAVNVDVDGGRVSIDIKLPPALLSTIDDAVGGLGESLTEAVKAALGDWLRVSLVDAEHLDDLEIGERFRVLLVKGGPRIRRRLHEVGVVVGAEAELVERQPLIVTVGDTRVGLSRFMAHRIMVKRLRDGDEAPEADEGG